MVAKPDPIPTEPARWPGPSGRSRECNSPDTHGLGRGPGRAGSPGLKLGSPDAWRDPAPSAVHRLQSRLRLRAGDTAASRAKPCRHHWGCGTQQHAGAETGARLPGSAGQRWRQGWAGPHPLLRLGTLPPPAWCSLTPVCLCCPRPPLCVSKFPMLTSTLVTGRKLPSWPRLGHTYQPLFPHNTSRRQLLGGRLRHTSGGTQVHGLPAPPASRTSAGFSPRPPALVTTGQHCLRATPPRAQGCSPPVPS